MTNNQDGYSDLNDVEINEEAINARKTGVYNQLNMISNQDGYPDLNNVEIDEEAINAMKTDVYNPLSIAAEAAHEGDPTKCALYVENIADVFFPTNDGEDPL